MERSLSVEEKIRRAEEIYAKRQEGNIRPTATVNVNDEQKKDIKLLKKMILQIIVCVIIYFTFYMIQHNDYFFSKEVIEKTKEVLSYDINFPEIYENGKQIVLNWQSKIQGVDDNTENDVNNGIGGAVEGTDGTSELTNNEIQNNGTENNELIDQTVIAGGIENQENQENQEDQQSQQNQEELQQISEEEQEIAQIKNTTSFIKPVEGTISSKYGNRNPTTDTVPKNHTGTDIAANLGTKIKSATDGEVVLASEEGDYGKHLKIQIGDVSIIYAHCNQLYVKQGDKITQGQEIAEVGSTGNSTGPHLHFEIRYKEKTIDPEKILSLT